MEEKEILKRIINNQALFNMIHVITRRYDILPDDKDHIGAYIEYQDIYEMRDEFVAELSDSIVEWIYSSKKYAEIKAKLMEKGRSERNAAAEIERKARQKFRGTHESDQLLVQGQLGELLLFHFIQKCMKAVPILRKMKIATSSSHERFGADAIHYKIEKGKNIIILGEAKTYTSDYKFADAFSDALQSILKTYNDHRKELNLYVHEDFLDDQMNEIAEKYLDNTLDSVEVQLVSIITYNEVRKLKKEDEKEIKAQIERIIEERYKSFDNKKIKIARNPILARITYIVFPVWDLEEIAMKFQQMI